MLRYREKWSTMQSCTKLLCFQSIQLSHQGDSAPYHSSLILCLIAPCNPTACLHLQCAQSNLNVRDAQALLYLFQETHTGTFSIADTAQRKRASTPLRTMVNVTLAFHSSPSSILQRESYIPVWIVHKTHFPGHKCLWLYLYSGIYGYGSLSALLKQGCKESR